MIITIIFVLLAIIVVGLLIKFIKNKNYKAIIIMFVVITIIGLSYFLYIDNKGYKYKIIYSGYISDFDNIIISSIDDYNEFMIDSNERNKKYKQKISSNKYNEKYFENKSLALVFIATGSSSDTFIGVDISTDNNILIVKPKIDYANVGTTDMTGKLILVEIDKSITQIEIER